MPTVTKTSLTDSGRGKKVFVAMSGGVDSAVAAALLKERGFEVRGVFFKPWQPRGVRFCPWEKDRYDALCVAEVLNIPFETWDFSREYQKTVGRYLINGYRQGATPNPDVMCNKKIKFGLFLKKVLAAGADFMATGHYVKIQNKKIKTQNSNSKFKIFYKLLKAKDQNKDQSYFLWTLGQKQLRHCLFPIGEYLKPEVRQLAKKFGLPVRDKKDSQGICFIGHLNLKEFLNNYIAPRGGEVVDLNSGRAVGKHEGAESYTIGQRHGLKITNGQGPYFVVGKDLKKNLIFASNQFREPELYTSGLELEKVSWINHPKTKSLNVSVRTRYRQILTPATLKILPLGRGRLKFKKPVWAVAPGQSAVFYRGQELLGGGMIRMAKTRL